MNRKQKKIAKHVIEVIVLLSKDFKLKEKTIWRFLNNRDPRFDDGKRTPLEVLWQDGESALRKLKDFLSSYRAGDYA